MIDNSTYIVGIYHSAEKAGYIPPRCGAVVLSVTGYAKTSLWDKTKNRFPTPFYNKKIIVK